MIMKPAKALLTAGMCAVAVLTPVVVGGAQPASASARMCHYNPGWHRTVTYGDTGDTVAQLQFGQVVLASIGSTAPFIGLFGTVWGIFHALAGMADGGGMTLDKIAGPVGEALIFTAAGLAVAIPAVLAYNVFGKRVSACEADLEGFAHDLREMQLDTAGGLARSRPAGDDA